MSDNTETAVAVDQQYDPWQYIEEALMSGDLTNLTIEERMLFYRHKCESIGLNPLSMPFQFITFEAKGKEPPRTVLYVTKSGTDQIRDTRGISLVSLEKEVVDGVLIVTATMQDKSGRQDTDIGAVPLTYRDGPMTGNALANAYMKAATKAKRRCTISITGLGLMDESEIDTVGPHRITPVTQEDVTAALTAPSEQVVEKPIDLWQRQMKRVHASAADYGVEHELLSEFAKAVWPVESMKQLNNGQLAELIAIIEQEGDNLKAAIEATLADTQPDVPIADVNALPPLSEHDPWDVDPFLPWMRAWNVMRAHGMENKNQYEAEIGPMPANPDEALRLYLHIHPEAIETYKAQHKPKPVKVKNRH